MLLLMHFTWYIELASAWTCMPIEVKQRGTFLLVYNNRPK